MQLRKPLPGELHELDAAHFARQVRVGIDQGQAVPGILQDAGGIVRVLALDHGHLAFFEQQRHD